MSEHQPDSPRPPCTEGGGAGSAQSWAPARLPCIESRMHMMGAEQMPARMPIGFAIFAAGVRATGALWQLESMGCSGN